MENYRNTRIRILEIGTGSGGIAYYLSTHPTLNCQVYAVDVVDSRLIKEGIDFTLVDGIDLPYEDGFFDVVITNHVIEHVGEYNEQLGHLREVKRVLKEHGVGYLAVPNRWMLIEPHYKLPFLSWIPKSLRSIYLRVMKKGNFYDCNPLSLGALSKLFVEAGLEKKHLEYEALKEFKDIEGSTGLLMSFVLDLPELWFDKIRWVSPTLICSFKK